MASKHAANKSPKGRERERESTREIQTSVFGNRMCKNTLARETDLVLLIGRVESLWTVLLALAVHTERSPA